MLDVSIRNGHRRRPMHPKSGMTLLEVLVAVTLLGLLSVGLLMSFRMGADSWQSTRDRLMLDRRIATANQILHSTLAGMIPVAGEALYGQGAQRRRFLFFQGEPHSMRFVSSYSVTGGVRGGLHVVELQVVNSTRGRRVLLNQSPFVGPQGLERFVDGFFRDPDLRVIRPNFRPIMSHAGSLVIADELEDCAFRYLERQSGVEMSTTWLPIWTNNRQLPQAVAINVLPRGDGNRLRPVSIAVPVLSLGWGRR